MSNTHIDLSDGSMVAAVVGRGYQLPKDIGLHPQLAMFDGLAKYPTGALPPLPANTKAILYTDGLALDRVQALKHEAQRRGIIYVNRGNLDAVVDVLRLWLTTGNKGGFMGGPNGHGPAPPTPGTPEAAAVEEQQKTKRGELQEIIKQADLRKGLQEEARRLFDLAKQKGLPTTYQSVENGLRSYKRKHGAGDIPASLMDPQERQRLGALKTLDEAIAGLQLMREWVEVVEAENAELKAFKASMTALVMKKGA